MPDLTTLLTAAAAAEQPDNQPEFADLAGRWRRRRRRRGVLAGAAVVVLVAVAAALIPLIDSGGKAVPDHPAASASASAAPAGPVEVTGILHLVGGPAGNAARGVAGQVHFRAADGAVTSAAAGDDGTFSVRLRPGTYEVSGTSPSFGDGAYPCAAAGPVRVTADGRHDVEVVCSMR